VLVLGAGGGGGWGGGFWVLGGRVLFFFFFWGGVCVALFRGGAGGVGGGEVSVLFGAGPFSAECELSLNGGASSLAGYGPACARASLDERWPAGRVPRGRACSRAPRVTGPGACRQRPDRGVADDSEMKEVQKAKVKNPIKLGRVLAHSRGGAGPHHGEYRAE